MDDQRGHFLIAIGDLCNAAALAKLEVEVVTSRGDVFVGVPAHMRNAAEGQEADDSDQGRREVPSEGRRNERVMGAGASVSTTVEPLDEAIRVGTGRAQEIVDCWRRKPGGLPGAVRSASGERASAPEVLSE